MKTWNVYRIELTANGSKKWLHDCVFWNARNAAEVANSLRARGEYADIEGFIYVKRQTRKGREREL